MITSTQIKVTLPEELHAQVEAKAKQLGLALSTYIRHLVIADVKTDYPVRQASKWTEEQYRKAMKRRNEAVEITDIESFFDKL